MLVSQWNSILLAHGPVSPTVPKQGSWAATTTVKGGCVPSPSGLLAVNSQCPTYCLELVNAPSYKVGSLAIPPAKRLSNCSASPWLRLMMAKLFFPFGLVPVLLGVLLRTVSAQVTLNQLFVVQRGANDGGCDRYFDQTTHTGTLDDWLDEINFSVAAAIDAIDQYDQDVRVRRAIQAFFGIRNQGRASANTRAKVQKISGKYLTSLVVRSVKTGR